MFKLKAIISGYVTRNLHVVTCGVYVQAISNICVLYCVNK